VTTDIETVTGQLVNLENPKSATINIEDIAWGLSRMPRFCGHTITVVPYNVAQHSMFVADEVERLIEPDLGGTLLPGLSYEQREQVVLKALLHDAAEIYTGDWPSPIKRIPKLRTIIKQIEAGLMSAVYEAMDLIPPTEAEEQVIKQADKIAQKIEANAFMPSRGKHWPDLPEVSLERLQQFSEPLDSLTSYKLFMEKFNSLR
jgi:5'-deoxynucleotidase YfbR-like HD superfamily hydrolase